MMRRVCFLGRVQIYKKRRNQAYYEDYGYEFHNYDLEKQYKRYDWTGRLKYLWCVPFVVLGVVFCINSVRSLKTYKWKRTTLLKFVYNASLKTENHYSYCVAGVSPTKMVVGDTFVEYRYAVNGLVGSSSRLSYNPVTRKHISYIKNRQKNKKPIYVYYDTLNPSQAVVFRGIDLLSYFDNIPALLIFLICFFPAKNHFKKILMDRRGIGWRPGVRYFALFYFLVFLFLCASGFGLINTI